MSDGRTLRSMLPREHGAWAQLGLPLVWALLATRTTAASWLFVLSSLALFLSHEPLLVVLQSHRTGERRDTARKVLPFLLSFGVLFGALGLLLSTPTTAALALVPAFLALLLTVFVLKGIERTTLGEVLAAAAMSSAALPVAIAGGLDHSSALHAWGAWTMGLACAVGAVRAVIAAFKGRSDPLAQAVLPVCSIVTLLAGLLLSKLWLSVLPLVLTGWILRVWHPHPRHLRRVGWTLVAATTLSLGGLLLLQ